MAHRLLSPPRVPSLSDLSSPYDGFYPTPSNSERLGPYRHHRPQTLGFEGQHDHRSHHTHPLDLEHHEMKEVLLSIQAELKSLSSSHSALLTVIKGLSSEISGLNSSHALLRAALDNGPGSSSLSTSLSAASLSVPLLNAVDYEDVKFWNKKDYTTEKKNRKSSTGFHQIETNDNIMTWYVEDETGEPVDGDTVENMRAYARPIWQLLLDSGMAPATWADANLTAHNYYEHHMTQCFPVLSYGASNWKAHMLATDNYSSWYGKRIGRKAKVKSEPVESDPTSADIKYSGSKAFKRSRSPSMKRPSKKLKTTNPSNGESQNMVSEEHDANHSSSSLAEGSFRERALTKESIAETADKVLEIPNPLAGVFSDIEICSGLIPPTDMAPVQSTSIPLLTGSTQSTSAPPEPSPVLTAPSCGLAQLATGSSTSALALLATSATFAANASVGGVSNSTIPAPVVPALTPSIASLSATSLLATSSMPTVGKKLKKAHAGDGKNAKSVCKREWVGQIGGTEAEFATYWISLGIEGQWCYEATAKALAKSTVSRKVDKPGACL